MLARLSFPSSLFLSLFLSACMSCELPPPHPIPSPSPSSTRCLAPPSSPSDGTFINSLESSVCSAWIAIVLNIPERCSIAVADDAPRQWGKYQLPGKLSSFIRLKVSEAKPSPCERTPALTQTWMLWKCRAVWTTPVCSPNNMSHIRCCSIIESSFFPPII